MILLSFLLLINFKLSLTVDPVVTIENGKIMGREGRTTNRNVPYYAFQGIPYAEPPVGNLRFQSPLPAPNWTGILNAQQDKAICIQLETATASALDSSVIEEDCLYINVYTPSLNQTDLPVLVYVHGGGFITGSSRYTAYPPDYFLEEGLVYVSMNYRFGIFGFMSTEDDVVPGNAGLKDQILALSWVQKNVRQFGGDPSNVTLYGQSAGAASVSYLQQSPLTEGMYQRVIISSGSSLHTWALGRNKRQAVFQTGQMLGIMTNNSRELVSALQNVSATSLFRSSLLHDVTFMGLTNPFNGLLFSPSIEPDLPGAVITKKSYSQLEEGAFVRVPTLIGFNSLEGLMFYSVLLLVRTYLAGFAFDLSKFAPISMHIDDDGVMKDVGRQIAEKFDMLNPIGASDSQLLQYISDDQFVRPTVKVAELQAQYAPVYFYEFTYQGDHFQYKNISGSGHADELAYVFAQIRFTAERDLLTRDRMVKLWTNFAKTSNPTPYYENGVELEWPIFTNETRYYMDIGDELIVKQHPVQDIINFWQELFEKYGNPPYDTY